MKDSIIAEKTFNFSLSIITLYKELQIKNEYVIAKQLLRSGTSIGANVEEALGGYSKKDFAAKMSITHKEARETKYWIKLLDKSQIVSKDYSTYNTNIDEILRILSSIVKTTKASLNS